MKNFFTAIVLIPIAGLTFAGYYLIRNIARTRLSRTIEERIKIKSYEDEKYYLKDFLRSSMLNLKAGYFSWVLVYSRLYPLHKAQVTFISLNQEIQILNRGRNLVNEEKRQVMKLGANSYERKGDKHIIHTPINSKIITDIIYYLFEVIYDQKRTLNLKIVISGG